MTQATSPQQQAAPAARRILTHARFELLTAVRNGEQLLLSLVLPALILVFLSRSDMISIDTALPRIDVVAPGVLCLAVMSSAFSGQAIATGFDRRAGALRMFATTPLGRGGLLGGKVVGVLGLQVLQVVVLGGIALALGWAPVAAGIGPAVLAWLLGTAAFTALGLLLAGTMRAEAVLAAANLLWVLLLAGGGSVLPGPAWTTWLPSGALGDALRAGLGTGTVDVAALAILTGWTVVLTILTTRLFKWA